MPWHGDVYCCPYIVTIYVVLLLVHTADVDKTKLPYLVSICVHTADADSSKLGQDETKLSCRWCEHNWRPDKTVLSHHDGSVYKPLTTHITCLLQLLVLVVKTLCCLFNLIALNQLCVPSISVLFSTRCIC